MKQELKEELKKISQYIDQESIFLGQCMIISQTAQTQMEDLLVKNGRLKIGDNPPLEHYWNELRTEAGDRFIVDFSIDKQNIELTINEKPLILRFDDEQIEKINGKNYLFFDGENVRIVYEWK